MAHAALASVLPACRQSDAPLWLPLWSVEDRGSAPKPTQLALEVRVTQAAAHNVDVMKPGQEGSFELGEHLHPEADALHNQRRNGAAPPRPSPDQPPHDLQPPAHHRSVSERMMRGYADENRTNAGTLLVHLDRMLVYLDSEAHSLDKQVERATFRAELELLPEHHVHTFESTSGALTKQLAEGRMHQAQWGRTVRLPIMYSETQRKVACLRLAIHRAAAPAPAVDPASRAPTGATTNTLQFATAQVDVSSFVLFSGRAHTFVLPLLQQQADDDSKSFVLLSVHFVPSAKGTPSLRHPGLPRHSPNVDQIVASFRRECERLAAATRKRRVQLDLQIVNVFLDPKAAGVLELGQELSLEFETRNSSTVRLPGVYPHRLADPNVTLLLDIVGEESVLVRARLVFPSGSRDNNLVGQCVVSVPFALASSGHMLEG